MTMPYDFDWIVVGGGPAGEKGAETAARLGKRVLLIERQPDPGGAAVHTGTLPSKTLRETALFLSGFRQRELYGVSVQLARDATVPKLIARKDAVRESEVARIRWHLTRLGVSIIRGNARFASANDLVVETGAIKPVTLTGEKILIATGSSPYKPPGIPFEDHDIDESDSILLLDRVPADLTVLGAGVIGCEYASIFAALGVQVTLVEARDRLLPFLDTEITERLRIALGRLGNTEMLATPFTRVRREGDKIVTSLENGRDLRTDKLLFTAGRQGNTRDLRLEEAGIVADKRGYVPVSAYFQTNVPNVYAAGDVVGIPASRSTVDGNKAGIAAHLSLYVVAHEGSNPHAVTVWDLHDPGGFHRWRERGELQSQRPIAYEVGQRHSIATMRAPRSWAITEGILKLVFRADATRQLLGVHILGDRASELVHVGQLALHHGGPIDTFVDMVFNYPTLSDCYKAAAWSTGWLGWNEGTEAGREFHSSGHCARKRRRRDSMERD